MNSHSFSRTHEASTPSWKLMRWYLCTLILLQESVLVKGMGRSTALRLESKPQGEKTLPLAKEWVRGFGSVAAHLSQGIPLASLSFKTRNTTESTAALRGSQHGNSGKHLQQQRLVQKLGLVASHWRHSLKMSTIMANLNALSGSTQVWAISMSIMLVLWVLRGVRHGLNSLLRILRRPSEHSEQLKCLINELEASVKEGSPRLPQGLQKEKKGNRTSGTKSTVKLEQTHDEKGYGPYLQVAGES
mmetsp:Transcript_63635/g.110907  ORF Transcript_63635/g.110907 Transcript_63635/m.110907 type:complete len:245 (-) Transcript_63635:378-1112(-)